MAKSAENELEKFIVRFTPEIASLARSAMEKVKDRVPGAQILVYDNYNALVIGFGPTEKGTDAILSLAVYPRWVSLFFLQGSKLHDPAKILKGNGVKARHIVLETLDLFESQTVQDLITQALLLAKIPIPGDEPGILIIKSVAAMQRPWRPSLKKKKDQP